MQFAKKKRRRSDSGSDVELDITPPPSPKEDELIEKRRSGRNTKRKKYVDDVDLNFSEEENVFEKLPAEGGADVKANGKQSTTASTPAGDGESTAPVSIAEAANVVENSQSGPNYAFIVSQAPDYAKQRVIYSFSSFRIPRLKME